MTLILASKSIARQNMLQAVNIDFESIPAELDEDTLTENAKTQQNAPREIALMLAQEKALAISKQHSGRLVIGSDQVLGCDGEMLTKAVDQKAAKEKLQFLRGKTHYLISAVSVVRDEDILWSHTDAAALTMKDVSDEALDAYCEHAGEALTRSVGAYEIEALGARLFEKIEGDFFTVQGMPLLPLLQYLEDEQGLSL